MQVQLQPNFHRLDINDFVVPQRGNHEDMNMKLVVQNVFLLMWLGPMKAAQVQDTRGLQI